MVNGTEMTPQGVLILSGADFIRGLPLPDVSVATVL
jgi:hypothetical protein